MTASAIPARSHRTFTPPSVVLAVGLVALAAVVVAANRSVRLFETAVAGSVLRLTGAHDVGSLGPNVLFLAKGRYVGVSLDPGCSAAFLVAPFLVLGAAMLLTGRVSLGRGLASTAFAVVLVFLANQARLLVIASAIRAWGLRTGYERSHVFLGTVVSTVGVLIGALAFFVLVSRGQRGRSQRA